MSSPPSPTAVPRLLEQNNIKVPKPNMRKEVERRTKKRIRETKPRQRASVPLQLKLDIIQFKQDNPFASLNDIKRDLHLQLDISTISKILKSKNEIIEKTKGMKKKDLKTKTKIQSGQFPVLDDALFEWFARARAQNVAG